MMTLDKLYGRIGEEETRRAKRYRLDWQSDDQWLCHLFLQKLFLGFHHMPRDPKPYGCGIELNFKPNYMSNFDYDMLTRMVIIAHNWGIRCEIDGSGPGMIKLRPWKRHKRDGEMYQRMPTIHEMVEKYKDH